MRVRKYRVSTYSGDVVEYEVYRNSDKVVIKPIGSEKLFETRVEKIDDNNYIVQIGYDKYRVVLANGRVFIDKETPLVNNIVELPVSTKPVSARKEEKTIVKKIERGEIKAPLSGKIESIRVKPGDRVKQGDVVLTMISMKMSVEVKSDVSGIVEEILVKQGDVVKTGDLLIRIKIE